VAGRYQFLSSNGSGECNLLIPPENQSMAPALRLCKNATLI
jgi:hypothetical protein